MDAGFAWGAKANAVAVYCDFGISEGMHQGISQARERGQNIFYRKILGKGEQEYVDSSKSMIVRAK